MKLSVNKQQWNENRVFVWASDFQKNQTFLNFSMSVVSKPCRTRNFATN